MPSDEILGVVSNPISKEEGEKEIIKDHPLGDDVGPILASHPCLHGDRRGEIHIGGNSLCFQSTNFFGFEQGPRVLIAWEDVGGLKHLKTGICVLRKDGSYLDFLEIKRRDEVFELMKFHSDNAENRNAFRGVVLEEAKQRAVGRASFIGGTGFDIKLVGDGGSEVHRSMKTRRIVENQAIDSSLKEASEVEYVSACLRASMVVDQTRVTTGSKSKRNLLGEIKTGKISEEGLATAQKYGIGVPDDLFAAWEEARDSETPSFVEVGIECVNLSCNLSEFNEKFLSDDAEKSFGGFLENCGDLEVETSSWKLSEDDKFSLTRKITYLHPVNAPLAPPEARASKEQCYRRFGDHGICVDTHTVVEDVPMTDCFYVDDRILVEPREEGGVRFTWRFEIRFVKGTMFRRIIETTTRSETVKGMDVYKSMLLESDAPSLEVIEEEVEGIEEEVEKTDRSTSEKYSEKKATITKLPKHESVVVSPKSAASMNPIVFVLAVSVLLVLQFVLFLYVRTAMKSFEQLSEKQDRLIDLMSKVLETSKGDAVRECSAGDY